MKMMLMCAVLLAPVTAAQAAAGQVLFALGRVEIQRGGQAFVAQRGTTVEVGDTLVTGPTGLTQVRMQDGALLSLRYGSTMEVQEFRMPGTSAAGAAPTVDAGSGATAGRSVLRLLRGAFRTVTGLIGKNAGDAYSVVTPVATIGIRGTDYSAAYCSGDCGSTPDGLYLGVSGGGIEVRNEAGALALGNDQYGYVKDNATPPGRELAPPEVLDAPLAPGEGEEDETREATDAAAGDAGAPDSSFRDDTSRGVATGDAPPEGNYEVRPYYSRYAYAGSGSGFGFKGAEDATAYADGRGGLLGFSGAGLSASIGTAANFDQGADATTGIYWGRWHGGIASVTTADGTNPVDLGTGSLHWIYAVESDAPTLLITGSRSYTLVGGTNPTDSSGATGVLGSASLVADFTNNFVDSTITVSFDNAAGGTTDWQASGRGTIGAGVFQGSYSTVSVGGTGGGSGGFTGFFTGDAGGAGLVFELNDANFTTTVTGAAAFVLSTSPAGGP